MVTEYDIMEEPLRPLDWYARIPIRYEVRSVLDVSRDAADEGEFSFVERIIAKPFVKDYDNLKTEGPLSWAGKWDISNWGLLCAVGAGQRVGGCVLAYKTKGLDMLGGKDDVTVLWDIRVQPDFRRSGIGTGLFAAAVTWAKRKQCRLLRVETQNINVPACRFYAAQGCMLEHVNRFAYSELPDEVQMIWCKTL